MNPTSAQADYTVISVESRKGGVGKTTAALVLANLLVERGYAVLLVDADITGTNTARAVQDSPIWRHRTKSVTLETKTNRNELEHDVLLELFDAFISGKQLNEVLRNRLTLDGEQSRFVVIGSRLVEQKEKPHLSPAILFDELHTYWFRVFLEDLCATFVRFTKEARPDKNVIVIIDNSPGFTGIAPALHDWLTDLGPKRGKFLTITSPDTQDITACIDSVDAIHERFLVKCKVSKWMRMAKDHDMQEDPLADDEVDFLVRLLESKPSKSSNDWNPEIAPLHYYRTIADGPNEWEQPATSDYQGLVVNKVIPLFLDKSVAWSPENLFRRHTSAHSLLFPGGDIRHRIVQYDENLELQFSQHLLRKGDTSQRHQISIFKRLEDLASFPKGVNIPNRLRDRPLEPQEVEAAQRACRTAFRVFQSYIERSVRLLEENRFAYISRLVRPQWFPRSPLEALRGAFISAISKSRDLPLYRGNSDIPLRPTPEGYRVLSSLVHDSRGAARRPLGQRNPSFLNATAMVVGLSLIDFLHEEDGRERVSHMFYDIAIAQAEQFAKESSEDENLQPTAFLIRQSKMRHEEVIENLRQRMPRHEPLIYRDFSNEIYPALCQAQARLLDLEGDARLLGWAIAEAVKAESSSPAGEMFLPDLRALLDPVILEKTVLHSQAKENADRILHGTTYLNRFSEPVREILKLWQI